ncbi:MAG: sugar phosphate isomerase/epimerase [Clostridia bacterium]|nr:sugar phosphate isomerase/epimerase [Clostridia bacterium]
MKLSIQDIATIQRYDLDTAFRMIREAGFEAVDWNLGLQWDENGKDRKCWDRDSIQSGKTVKQNCIFDEDMDQIFCHYDPILQAIRKNGLSITQAHAPFHTYSSKNLPFADYAAKTYEKVLKLCRYADCPRVVIHGFSKLADDYGITDRDVYEANMKMYRALIPTALETGVMVLLENLFTNCNNRKFSGVCSDPHEAVSYIDTLNEMAGKEVFGLCFDVGHLNLVRRAIPEYVEILGSRIRALHIHDNDGDRDLHQAPFTGTVRWNDFCDSLRRIGYRGDLNLEAYKQTLQKRCPDEMVMPSLRFMAQTVDHFRNEILK